MVDLPPSAVDPERARQVVADVLSRAEYADAAPGLWDRIQAEVARILGELWLRLAGTGAGDLIGYGVLAALALVAVLIGWRLARSLRREGQREEPLAGDVGRSPGSWVEEAEAHELAGRWREAVRCRYRALIADLAAHGRIQEIPGRTAGEYLEAVRSDLPGAAEPFARATRAFESAWYGPDEVSRSDVAVIRDAAEEVRPAAVGEAPR